MGNDRKDEDETEVKRRMGENDSDIDENDENDTSSHGSQDERCSGNEPTGSHKETATKPADNGTGSGHESNTFEHVVSSLDSADSAVRELQNSMNFAQATLTKVLGELDNAKGN